MRPSLRRGTPPRSTRGHPRRRSRRGPPGGNPRTRAGRTSRSRMLRRGSPRPGAARSLRAGRRRRRGAGRRPARRAGTGRSAAASTGSISRRSAARERRRIRRSTSGSTPLALVPCPAGTHRAGRRRPRPSALERRGRSVDADAERAPRARRARNGPCVRAIPRDEVVERRSVGPVNAAGTPERERDAERVAQPRLRPRPPRGVPRRPPGRAIARPSCEQARHRGVRVVRHAGRDLVGPERSEVAQQVVDAVGPARPSVPRRAVAARAPPGRAPRGRGARAGPRTRAARAAGRGRARARPPAAPRAARRPSYMKTAIQRNSSDWANGEARSVSTATTPGRAASRIGSISSRSAGTSKWSRRHSRVVSSRIGKSACCAARRRAGPRSAVAAATAACAARATPRQQQRARRRLAEHAGEQRRAREGGDHGLLDLVGVEEQVLDRDPFDGLRQPEHDAVVGPQDLGAGTEPLVQTRLDGERPGREHPGAERRQDADAPVAELVAEPLDHDRSGRRGRARRGLPFVNVVDQVVGGPARPGRGRPGGVASAASRRYRPQLPREPPDRSAELGRSARSRRLPEGELAVLPGRGRDTTTRSRVMSSIRHDVAPSRKTSPLRRLVDALLVELADARAVGGEHAEQARGRGSCRRS